MNRNLKWTIKYNESSRTREDKEIYERYRHERGTIKNDRKVGNWRKEKGAMLFIEKERRRQTGDTAREMITERVKDVEAQEQREEIRRSRYKISYQKVETKRDENWF